MNNKATRELIKKIFVWTGVIFFLIWTIFPFFWALSVSVKPAEDLNRWPPVYITSKPTLQNYFQAFERNDLLPYAIRNSLVIMLVSSPISVFLSALGGYALARFNFLGKEALKFGLLSIRMIPGILIAIPMFIIAKKLGAHDSMITLIVAYVAFNLPFNMWMLTGFFEEIPKEIEESAMMDGCSPLQTFTRIVLPLSTPALMASTIFCMLLSWNEFQFAVILTFTKASRTLPIVLSSYVSDRGIRYGEMAANGALAILPVLAIGIYLQRYLVRGLTAGAVKG